MKPLTIRSLKLSDEAAFLHAVNTWDTPDFHFAGGYDPTLPFPKYVQALVDEKNGINLPSNFVPNSVFFAFLGGEIAGRLSVRHKLNDHLFRVGGHIGYGVLPKFRRRGIATELLGFGLAIAKELGIEKALVTCDDNNHGSIKVIQNWGGVLEDLIKEKGMGIPKRRYWVQTDHRTEL